MKLNKCEACCEHNNCDLSTINILVIKSRNVYNNAKTNCTLTFFANSQFYFFIFKVLWFNEENSQVGFVWLTATHLCFANSLQDPTM